MGSQLDKRIYPLAGRLAIVTGASRGIGVSIAQSLAAKGSNLILGYNTTSSQSKAEKIANELAAEHGISAWPIQADLGTVSGPADLVRVAKETVLASGAERFQVDILINNAGVSWNNHIPDIKPDEFDQMYHVNVLGPLLLVQAVEPYLPHDRSGRIVNVSSISATVGLPGQSVYGGTKAALDAMTRSWARELSERATVNSINPGPVKTEMYGANTPEFRRLIKSFLEHTPLMQARPGIDSEEDVKMAEEDGGRLGHPHEIAGIVGMLCSAESGWCTGQVVSANGGMLLGTQ